MKIEGSFIKSVCNTLRRGKSVNRRLPGKGKIVMDKVLPFLCLYRYNRRPDPLFLKLIKTQAAYLIVDDQVDIGEFVKCISAAASAKLNAFMIIELWSDQQLEAKTFKIYGPSHRAPTTVQALEKGLKGIKSIYPLTQVEVVSGPQRHPWHLAPVLNIEDTKEAGSLFIGISIPSIYIDSNTKNIYTIFFYKLVARVSRVIKKGVYEFIRVQTANKFSHYLMLGKTRLNKVVINADAELAEISDRMNFLMRVTPVNSSSEWRAFKENKFRKPPAFNYRLIDIDPEIEKRKLFKIPLERIEDPTLSFILRDKRLELEKQLTMLEERETESFRHIGESLYGTPDDYTLKVAKVILRKIRPNGYNGKAMVSSNDFAVEAQKEMDFYQNKFPDLQLKLQVRKDVNSIMVSKSNLLINSEWSFSEERVDALIHHEVSTHILTYCNGRQQPFKQMYAGFAGYDQLQEGLAVLAEYLVGGLTNDRLRLLAARVVAVDYLLHKADFIEVFRNLTGNYGFGNKLAFNIAMRVFRGGGFTKDALYLKGLLELLAYLKNGGKIEILYAGKFDLRHVHFINELMHRNIIKKPLLPTFYDDPIVQKRLKKLQSNVPLTELLN